MTTRRRADVPNDPDSPVRTEQVSSIRCCLCREHVLMSGWCPNCRTWPINITPRRWDDRGHPVDVDGLCRICCCIVLTRLVPESAEWRDTRQVATLLSREDNLSRIRALMASLSIKSISRFKGGETGKGSRPELQPWDHVSPHQRTQEELERQKAVVLGMNGDPVADTVPF